MGNISAKENHLLRSNSLVGKTNGNGLSVEVFNSFEGPAYMQQEWDEFVESVGGEIFLTYDWCRIWWKYYGKNRKLRVFIFRSNNQLVGIIPLFLERIWLGPILIRAAKIVGSDFTIAQFSLPIHNKHIKGVIQKFFKLLSSEHNWDIMHIGAIAGLYNHYDELSEILYESLGCSYHVSVEKEGVQTYFPLADSWEAQLASLSKNGRRNITRNYNALNRTLQNEPGNLVSHFATNEDFDEVFSGFVRMHQLHWQKIGKLGHFGDWPLAFEFHSEMAKTQLKHNRLRLMVSSWGSCCLGYEYAYKFGSNYFAILNSRSESEELRHIGLGQIIFSEQVKKALAENVKHIDAMRGRYEHKLRLGGELFPTRNLYVVPKRWATVVRVRLFRLFAYLLNFFYYRIWFGRIAPKLNVKRKPLWKIWIRTCGFA